MLALFLATSFILLFPLLIPNGLRANSFTSDLFVFSIIGVTVPSGEINTNFAVP